MRTSEGQRWAVNYLELYKGCEMMQVWLNMLNPPKRQITRLQLIPSLVRCVSFMLSTCRDLKGLQPSDFVSKVCLDSLVAFSSSKTDMKLDANRWNMVKPVVPMCWCWYSLFFIRWTWIDDLVMKVWAMLIRPLWTREPNTRGIVIII